VCAYWQSKGVIGNGNKEKRKVETHGQRMMKRILVVVIVLQKEEEQSEDGGESKEKPDPI